MKVSQSDCSSVSLVLPNSSVGKVRRVVPREDYSIGIAVVLASVTDNGSLRPAPALSLYSNAAAVASAFGFAAYALY